MISSSSVAKLVAVTDEARRALRGKPDVGVTQFPFKVGRESRLSNVAPNSFVELRLGVVPQLNDLYLLEPPWSDLMHISREHFSIDYIGNQFIVVDRGSVCGTIVAGTPIGGNRTGGRAKLLYGDEITVGTAESRYIFRFEVAAG